MKKNCICVKMGACIVLSTRKPTAHACYFLFTNFHILTSSVHDMDCAKREVI